MSIKDQIPLLDQLWYAVKCKYRCEKTLMAELKGYDIETYVPIQTKVRQYASRKKISEVALIPAHIFVRINRSSYLPVIRHMHVYGFLNFSGNLCPIPQSEMDIMKRVVGECDDIKIGNTDFSSGDEVQIIGGELTGLKGILIEADNHNFKIALTSLGMGLMIRVEPKYLLKIGSKKKVA